MARLTVVPMLLLSAAAGAAAPAPDESPAVPGEWGFRPADGLVSSVDPPGFVWRPQKGAVEYAVQIASDPDFAGILRDDAGLTLACHCPPEPLGPGRYFWRFRYADAEGAASPWSSMRSFVIDGDSRPFPMPERADLLRRIPEGHPRLFVRPEGVAELRDLAEGRLRGRWEAFLADCEKMLADPPDVSEPLRYLENEKRGVNDDAWRARWWGNRRRVLDVTDKAASLAFAWRIGGDERHASEARRLLLAACAWDPVGATGYVYNDEAGMPFAYTVARTYTWLHDYLSEEDRRTVREVMKIRGNEMYAHLSGINHIWRPYGSHANRAWHYLGEVGAAFHGEIAEAADWVWFAMNVFFNSYPVWNDDEGGWHEGMAYWSSYLTRVTWWLATMQPTFGLDGYRKPFFANAGDFALYVSPPGETLGGFGDLTRGFTAARCSSLMSVFARMTGNPYWQWYVEQSGGADLPGGYMGLLHAALPAVESRPPTDLPSSVLFPGVGVAALHNNLTDRDDDVLFMLKSSPMGTQSHGYDSQNAFLLSVAGDPVFIYTGGRDLYGSPHHRYWMWQTRSQNSILVNGQGQKIRSSEPLGEITRFSTSADFDYVVGEAAPAYEGRLDRFTRAVLFIKPHAIVIFDALEAPAPGTFQWLLHAPNELAIEGQTIHAFGARHGASAQLLAPEGMRIRQTNEFDPPPQHWVKLTQWHLTADTVEAAAAMDFVTVLRPFAGREPPAPLPARAVTSADALACELDLPGGRAVVVWRRSGQEPISFAGLETDGEAACAVLDDDGKVRRTFVHGGRRVVYEGNRLDPR